MMKTIFISGSIRIKHITDDVCAKLDRVIHSNMKIILGDATGVDKLLQEYLASAKYQNVVVYCAGQEIRNNIGNWNVKKVFTNAKPKTRKFYTSKDLEMAKDCDWGLMIWDKISTGTLSNVVELLKKKKQSLVYLDDTKEFMKISNVDQLEALISMMKESDVLAVDKRIQIKKVIKELKQFNFL